MTTKTKEKKQQDIEPTLQLKRDLLSIDEYAKRQDVHPGLVKEWIKLGIVQTRKHKGKTFVVDVPLDTYPHTSEETEREFQPAPTPQRDTLPAYTSTLSAMATSRRFWQFITIASLILLATTAFTSFWFYADRNTQLDRLDLAYMRVRNMYDASTRVQQNLQNELADTKTQLNTVRSELAQTTQNFDAVQQRIAQTTTQFNKQLREFAAQLTELTDSSQTTGPDTPGK